MTTVRWEWDEAKRRSNIERHGLDFREIPAMFEHPVLRALDKRENYGEDRWIGIGLLGSRVVVVVCVESQPDAIRIISARKASKYER